MADYASLPRFSDLVPVRAWRHRFAAVVDRLLEAASLPVLMQARAPRRTRTVSDAEHAATPAVAADEDAQPKIVPPTPTDDPDSIRGGSPTFDFEDCCAVGNANGWFCTGTLIAPNLVVTAEHCDGATRVFLKGENVANPAGGEIIDVAEGKNFAHPTADLRVMVLERDSSVEKPRRIARGPNANATTATLAGFGTVDFNGVVGYGVKRRVDVPIVSIDCSAAGDAATFGCTPGKEMVAGQRGLAMDSCRGDSGGPLYVTNTEGETFLLGATSRGIANANVVCGDGGIYVRVEQFTDWMTEQTGVSI